MGGVRKEQLRNPKLLERITELKVGGSSMREISETVETEFGVKTSGQRLNKLLETESYKNSTIILKNAELLEKAKKTMERSLNRIDKGCDILWAAIQKFKDPEDTKEVVALTTLMRTLKDNIEVNLRFIGGAYTQNQINIGSVNLIGNDIELAGKIAKQMDEICSKCEYKHPKKAPKTIQMIEIMPVEATYSEVKAENVVSDIQNIQ